MKKCIILLLILATVGCSQKAEQAATETVDASTVPPSTIEKISAEVTPELSAQLVAADRLDGSEDKVVSKCASCALHMNGKEEFALELADYRLDFCSDFCQNNYREDGAGKLMALKIAAAPEAN